jgi:hypothetical protein
LFLDPAAPDEVISGAHADSVDDFRDELRVCLKGAEKRLRECGVPPEYIEQICRKYVKHRTHEVLIVDNLLLYAPTGLNLEGKPREMTNVAFSAIHAEHSYAMDLLTDFDAVWNTAEPIS